MEAVDIVSLVGSIRFIVCYRLIISMINDIQMHKGLLSGMKYWIHFFFTIKWYECYFMYKRGALLLVLRNQSIVGFAQLQKVISILTRLFLSCHSLSFVIVDFCCYSYSFWLLHLIAGRYLFYMFIAITMFAFWWPCTFVAIGWVQIGFKQLYLY